MIVDEDHPRRVRFFGVHDLASGWYVERVAEIVESFDPSRVPTSTVDIIELHNVQQYLENDFLPQAYTQEQRDFARSQRGNLRAAVARYFSAIDEATCSSVVADVGYEYHADLLELLGRSGAFERCAPTAMLPALKSAGVNLGTLLTCKRLVAAYDNEMRDELLASPRNAEHVIRKHLQRDIRGEVYLPTSFKPEDSRDLLASYIDYPDANPNYVSMIETAQVSTATGVDAKLKLRAKRRSAETTQRFFEENAGFKTGTEVGLSDTQVEPARYEVDESDGLVIRLTYSRRWLEDTLDNPSILNNFQHLFEFANRHTLLTLPSYPARLGVFERFMTTTGRTDYHIGAAFRSIDQSSLLQTRLYQHFLGTKDVDIEDVFRWFFEEYLPEEFGAKNFSFTPSSRGASYLEKVRHLFVEMESVVNQFTLFVEDGELDRDLLAITSAPVRYRQVPSLLTGKYLYATTGDGIVGILHHLFSDQSGLAYIDEDLKADDAASLFLENEVGYEDLHDFQNRTVDQLIELGIMENHGSRLRIRSAEQFIILKALFDTRAASYYHLSEAGRAEADAMTERGWTTRQSSLLTEAEGQYFNYFLNKVDFSNGPELRNKYLHGSQANADGEDAHFHTYVTALRLTTALIIKLNDDFCLTALAAEADRA
ncbi:hypothetical protein FHX52_3882 [Humibacillus xanthopallidus]|uniref:Uncharacterized protein n=1 Tax=Humibacillus xanthopallidus TaxID=412689 RepID=A0A543PKR2_9MICO|nr:hypothetical protein [Humibacillus xanthopallidus]TQN44662.1 hypothetical protein FHX52_3882 [Humibacillus xanthopallidus]